MRAALLTALLCALPIRTAAADEAIPPELADIEIADSVGAHLPGDLELTDQTGAQVKLGSYWADGKPVILVLAYYQCPMLCTLVLNDLQSALKQLDWTAGKEFRVVTVSIDPRDTIALAAEKRTHYLKAYGRDVGARGWEFLIGDPAAVRRLANVIGFHYRWDEATKQFAHAAGIFVVTPDGRLSRTLYGMSYRAQTVKLALLEASAGRLGTVVDRVRLFCFHYDPNARGYVLAAGRIVRIGGALTLLIVLGTLAFLFRHDIGHSRAEHSS